MNDFFFDFLPKNIFNSKEIYLSNLSKNIWNVSWNFGNINEILNFNNENMYLPVISWRRHKCRTIWKIYLNILKRNQAIFVWIEPTTLCILAQEPFDSTWFFAGWFWRSFSVCRRTFDWHRVHGNRLCTPRIAWNLHPSHQICQMDPASHWHFSQMKLECLAVPQKPPKTEKLFLIVYLY